MHKIQDKIIVTLIAASLIIGGVYIVGQQQVKKSVELLELEYHDFKVVRLSLIPPEMDLILTYRVTNPSEIPLKIRVDGAIYYEETRITPIIVEERLIPVMDFGEIEAQITLNGSLLQLIRDPQSRGNYRLMGTLTVTGQYMGILPISVELDLAEIESGN